MHGEGVWGLWRGAAACQGVEGGRSVGACARGVSMPVCRHGGVAGSNAALHAKVRSMVAVGQGARRGGRDVRADGSRVSRQSLSELSNEGNTAWVEGVGRAWRRRVEYVRDRAQVVHSVRVCRRRARARVWRGRSMREAVRAPGPSDWRVDALWWQAITGRRRGGVHVFLVWHEVMGTLCLHLRMGPALRLSECILLVRIALECIVMVFIGWVARQ